MNREDKRWILYYVELVAVTFLVLSIICLLTVSVFTALMFSVYSFGALLIERFLRSRWKEDRRYGGYR